EPRPAARHSLSSAYEKQLAELADWCDDHQLSKRATEVRQWLPKREPNQFYFFDLDDYRRAAMTPDPTSGDARPFRERVTKLRVNQAEQLYALAERAAREGQTSVAYQLIVETAR